MSSESRYQTREKLHMIFVQTEMFEMISIDSYQEAESYFQRITADDGRDTLMVLRC